MKKMHSTATYAKRISLPSFFLSPSKVLMNTWSDDDKMSLTCYRGGTLGRTEDHVLTVLETRAFTSLNLSDIYLYIAVTKLGCTLTCMFVIHHLV